MGRDPQWHPVSVDGHDGIDDLIGEFAAPSRGFGQLELVRTEVVLPEQSDRAAGSVNLLKTRRQRSPFIKSSRSGNPIVGQLACKPREYANPVSPIGLMDYRLIGFNRGVATLHLARQPSASCRQLDQLLYVRSHRV